MNTNNVKQNASEDESTNDNKRSIDTVYDDKTIDPRKFYSKVYVYDNKKPTTACFIPGKKTDLELDCWSTVSDVEYKQCKNIIQNLWDEFVKMKDATGEYLKACSDLDEFHDGENNSNDNDEYRNVDNVVGLIIEMKKLLPHVTKVIPQIMCFKDHLMHSVESLESTFNHVSKVEAQKELWCRSIETVGRYKVMPNSLSSYEQCKEAIKIFNKEVALMDTAVQKYVAEHQEHMKFGDLNKNDFYAGDNLREFCIKIK